MYRRNFIKRALACIPAFWMGGWPIVKAEPRIFYATKDIMSHEYRVAQELIEFAQTLNGYCIFYVQNTAETNTCIYVLYNNKKEIIAVEEIPLSFTITPINIDELCQYFTKLNSSNCSIVKKHTLALDIFLLHKDLEYKYKNQLSSVWLETCKDSENSIWVTNKIYPQKIRKNTIYFINRDHTGQFYQESFTYPQETNVNQLLHDYLTIRDNLSSD